MQFMVFAMMLGVAVWSDSAALWAETTHLG